MMTFKDLLEVCFATEKADLITTLKDSGLRGRGGAGFPTGMKWEFCKDQEVTTKYVVCNADEGDPGAFSDRYLLEEQPLKVLFGMVICAILLAQSKVFYIFEVSILNQLLLRTIHWQNSVNWDYLVIIS